MNSFVLSILVGSAIIGALCAIMGVFNLLLKRPLIADSIAHATLPGIALGFLLFNEKNILILFIGACTTSMLSIFYSDWLKRKSKLKNDSIMAIGLSTFFSIGLCLVSYVQNQNSGKQTGLENYLFGNASSLNIDEMMYASIILIALLAIFAIFHKRFQLVLFNIDYAKSIGLNSTLYLFLISLFSVLAIALSVKAMGIVLASALLISPALAMRYWRTRFVWLFILAGVVGAVTASFGAYLSYAYNNTPTGSAIVLSLFIFVVFSVAFGNSGGLIKAFYQQRSRRRKIIAENVLKLFYYSQKEHVDGESYFTESALLDSDRINENDLKKGLKILTRKGIISFANGKYKPSPEGWEYTLSLVRRHRLWELYLTHKLNLDAFHVHQDAEMAEHLITEKIEAQLLRYLDNPDTDPHNQQIP
tara:strand:+ start:122975 stop:124228 length:1254 start_codon:yes stop_codon:yes gene_type:complete